MFCNGNHYLFKKKSKIQGRNLLSSPPHTHTWLHRHLGSPMSLRGRYVYGRAARAPWRRRRRRRLTMRTTLVEAAANGQRSGALGRAGNGAGRIVDDVVIGGKLGHDGPCVKPWAAGECEERARVNDVVSSRCMYVYKSPWRRPSEGTCELHRSATFKGDPPHTYTRIPT